MGKPSYRRLKPTDLPEDFQVQVRTHVPIKHGRRYVCYFGGMNQPDLSTVIHCCAANLYKIAYEENLEKLWMIWYNIDLDVMEQHNIKKVVLRPDAKPEEVETFMDEIMTYHEHATVLYATYENHNVSVLYHRPTMHQSIVDHFDLESRKITIYRNGEQIFNPVSYLVHRSYGTVASGRYVEACKWMINHPECKLGYCAVIGHDVVDGSDHPPKFYFGDLTKERKSVINYLMNGGRWEHIAKPFMVNETTPCKIVMAIRDGNSYYLYGRPGDDFRKHLRKYLKEVD